MGIGFDKIERGQYHKTSNRAPQITGDKKLERLSAEIGKGSAVE